MAVFSFFKFYSTELTPRTQPPPTRPPIFPTSPARYDKT